MPPHVGKGIQNGIGDPYAAALACTICGGFSSDSSGQMPEADQQLVGGSNPLLVTTVVGRWSRESEFEKALISDAGFLLQSQWATWLEPGSSVYQPTRSGHRL